MFTFFTDRDGKYQLAALAESGFDPLSRTCRFMLTEEAHHMFVGETGVMRVVQRTGEVMRELGTDDPERLRAAGVIDLPTVQKYINFHYSVSVDLFGQEVSTNAANYFTAGLKGRYLESRLDDDHRLTDDLWPVYAVRDGHIAVEELSALSAVNERLRRRLYQGLPEGAGPLEPRAGNSGRGLPAGTAPPLLQPAHRQRFGGSGVSRRADCQRGRMASQRVALAPHQR